LGGDDGIGRGGREGEGADGGDLVGGMGGSQSLQAVDETARHRRTIQRSILTLGILILICLFLGYFNFFFNNNTTIGV
jgi:hypothetical protein